MIVLFCALVLGAVLGFAGVRKLLDREGSRPAMAALGVPAPLIRPLSWALPAAEIATALALLPPASRFAAGICAAALLTSFTVLLSVNLLRGRRPVCACFGDQSQKPISWYSAARNALLLALAAVVISGYDPQIAGRTALLTGAGATGLALVSAVIVLSWVVVHLARLQATLVERVRDLESLAKPNLKATEVVEALRGLSAGEPLPTTGLRRDEEIVAGPDWLDPDRATLLMLVSDACGACQDLVDDDLPRLRVRTDLAVVLALVHRPSAASPTRIWLEAESVHAWGVRATPAAILVAPSGQALSAVVYGATEIKKMADRRLVGAA